MEKQESAYYLFFKKYRISILIFLGMSLLALTVMHPQILITDEWITANQLAQLSQGHQVIVTEGKYGVFENGTINNYFKAKNNLLGYSIFLPAIALPILKIIETLGISFSYILVVLSAILLILIALVIDLFFPEWSIFRNYHWTSWLIIAAFVFFVLKLLFLIPITVSGPKAKLEVYAIVLTYVLLYALIAVLIYEIVAMISDDSWFRILGTIICLSGSSYLIWMSCAKDQLLAAFLFISIIYTTVKFHHTKDSWYFPCTCILTGLLAWTRPELALPLLVAVIIYYWGSALSPSWKTGDTKKIIFFVTTPLFTLIGAIPFFINNYYVTGNPLAPTFLIWPSGTMSPTAEIIPGTGLMDPTVVQKILGLIFSSGSSNPDTFLRSLYGIFLNPQNGSMALMAVAPFFLTAVLLTLCSIFLKKNWLADVDREVLIIMMLFSGAAFLAYFGRVVSMNISVGIIPDIRYLSTMYVPLNIIGLLLLKKSLFFEKGAKEIVKLTVVISMVCIPIILIGLKLFYPIPVGYTPDLFTLYNNIMSIFTYVVILIFFVLYSITELNNRSKSIRCIFLAIIIIMPFLWQVGVTYIMGLRLLV
jgi:hypothetical protein